MARENFTFSLRVNVGEFSEAVIVGGDNVSEASHRFSRALIPNVTHCLEDCEKTVIVGCEKKGKFVKSSEDLFGVVRQMMPPSSVPDPAKLRI